MNWLEFQHSYNVIFASANSCGKMSSSKYLWILCAHLLCSGTIRNICGLCVCIFAGQVLDNFKYLALEQFEMNSIASDQTICHTNMHGIWILGNIIAANCQHDVVCISSGNKSSVESGHHFFLTQPNDFDDQSNIFNATTAPAANQIGSIYLKIWF